MNLYDLFRDTAHEQPDLPAVLGPRPDDLLSYRALLEAIDAAAERLAKAGVRPGSCVGLDCPSGAAYITLTYAVWRCGGCVVPIPAELTAAEKQAICRDIALDLVVSGKRGGSFLGPFRCGAAVEVPPLAVAVPVASGREHPPGFRGINSAFLRFTSGTTGAAKGVVLSHETIRDRIRAANEVLGVGRDDRVVWLLSMAYHFAVSIVGYLTFGAAVILPPNHFGRAVLAAARRHRATLMYGSPAHYAWMAEADPAGPLPDLRLALSTTAALSPEAARKFQERFGLPVTQVLGIIEVGLPFINLDFAADRPGGVGRVLPAYRLRLEDVGLGPGLGEVLLSGPGFLDAYYEPWRPRQEVMPDGWFRTGDVGEVDADGCLFLRGRVKDVINVMGMKFFPQEVEAVLASHPGVASACVLAEYDERLGEVPYAQVVPRVGAAPPSARELLDHCRAQLTDFKLPGRIEFVEVLRRTASGKLLRRRGDARAEAGRDRLAVESQ